MSNEVWFRAVDGREVCCEPKSDAAILLAHDRSFVRIDGPQGEVHEFQGPEPVIVDLSWMSEFERIELAKTILGI